MRFRLYRRGPWWWADLGKIGGVRRRLPLRTEDREEAGILANALAQIRMTSGDVGLARALAERARPVTLAEAMEDLRRVEVADAAAGTIAAHESRYRALERHFGPRQPLVMQGRGA